MHLKTEYKNSYHIRKLPSIGWMENKRSGLWCQSLNKHSIVASKGSTAFAEGPESVAKELIEVVALQTRYLKWVD